MDIAQVVACCSNCGKDGAMETCSLCDSAQYCSLACTVKHWLAHKAECMASEKKEVKTETSEYLKLFDQCLSAWINRMSESFMYLFWKQLGNKALDIDAPDDSALYLKVMCDIFTYKFRVQEVATLDLNKLVNLNDSYQDEKKFIAGIHGDEQHISRLIVVYCGPLHMSNTLVFSPDEAATFPSKFDSTAACLKFMAELEPNDQPKAQHCRRFPNGLSRFKAHPDYIDFLWNAFNMDTMFPLNESHSLVVTIQSNDKHLVSFKLVSVDQLAEMQPQMVAEEDEDEEKVAEPDQSSGIVFRCIFVDDSGNFTSTDSNSFAREINTTSRCTVAQSQKTAREKFETLKAFWSDPKAKHD